MTERIRLAESRGASHVDFDKRIIYGASAIQAVEALGHRLMVDEVALRQVAELGNSNLNKIGRKRDGVKVRFTHPGLSSDGFGKTLGRAKNFRVEGDKCLCDIHLVPSAFRAGLDGGESLGEYVMRLADEDPDLFGLSIVFQGHAVWVFQDGSEREADRYERPPEGATTKHPLVRVDRLDAVDAVDEPAANRDGMFSEYSAYLWATNQQAEAAYADIDALLERYGVAPEKARDFALRYFARRGVPTSEEEVPKMEEEVKVENSVATHTHGLSQGSAGIVLTSNSANPAPAPVADNGDALAAINARLAEMERQNRLAEFRIKLLQSGLSAEGQEVVLSAVNSGVAPEKADGLIESQRKAEAKLREATTIQGITPVGGARINGMMSDLDKFTVAFEALLDGKRPERGVKPLSGIREAYTMLSGDFDMTGRFEPQNIGFASITTATMPNIMANVLNKKVISMFNVYDRWWEKLVVTEDAANMQQLRWHKLGGIGEMPTVNEGATYTETDWNEDYETADWNKKGHYLGLTLEAIDKDDTRRLLEAPRALAQSAYLTISKDISRLFTQNSGAGPTMRDTKAWFHVDHANLGSSALSYTSLKATIQAMRKQTELGTGERLTGGWTKPKYFLVPIELEDTALEILASQNDPNEGTTTSYEKQNILADGDSRGARLAAARSKLVVMDHWTDTNNWAALADPQLFPSIGLGFRFGREPELFSVADPNSGLMFTNDTMPIKVRWFYSLGIIDHRGVYKHNVA